MALQDLTPQLRTRLHRVEKIVSVFVVLATLLLLAGFGYYLYDTAARKGWFIPKCRYHTLLMSAEGLKVGDQVILMGFNVGEIIQVEAQPPDSYYKIYISFDVRRPYYGYIWSDSKLRITAALLGGRRLEVLPGYDGKPTVEEQGDQPAKLLIKSEYVPLAKAPKGVYVEALEDPDLSARAQQLVNKVEAAIPGILGMTNQINGILTNVVHVTANLNQILLDTRPILTNAQIITANLRDPNCSLGNWLIPTNLNARLDTTLGSVNTTVGSANTTVTNVNAQITLMTAQLQQVLLNVTTITSNLNMQLQSNDDLLGNMSDLLIETEDMMRGLKRHWLLKSAFPTPTIEPPPLLLEPQVGGKQP